MKRVDFALLAFALALAMGLRLWVASTPMCISTDGVFFVQLAEQIAAGGLYFHPQVAITPGYSALLAFLQGLFGYPIEQIARYVSVACATLMLIPAWLGWRLLFGPTAAGCAAVLTACWPMSVELGSGVYYEPLSLLGLFSGWYLFLEVLRGRHWGWAAGVALCWGAVAWMKPEILAWNALAAAALVWRRQWHAAILLAAVAALVYLPYVVMVHEHSGQWSLAAKQDINALKAQAIGQENYHSAVEALRDMGERGQLEASFPGPVALGKRLAVNVLLLHRYAVAMNWPPVLIALAAVGFLLAWRQRQLSYWLLLPALAALPLLFFQIEARIWHPLFAVAMGLVGMAVAHVEGRGRWLLLVALLCLLVPQALRPVFRTHVDAAEQRAGLWLEQHAEAGDIVLDRKPFVAYYAGLSQIWPLKRPGLDGLREILEEHESTVLVVDNRYFRRSRPEWYEALACPPEWLRERARFTGPDGHLLRLFSYRRSP